MTKFCFNWIMSGSYIIEAQTQKEAKEIFDKISVSDTISASDQVDFITDQILIEVEPGYFEEVESEEEEEG